MTNVERCPHLDFDLLNRHELEFDPFESFLEHRERDPFWTEDDDGVWVVTKFEHVREVQKDYRTFTHTQPKVVLGSPLMPSFFDPPDQTKQRSIVLPLMTADRIDPLEPMMHEVCRDLIASFRDRGHCDAAAEFARKYPIAIFSALFGLPEARREEFRQLAEVFLHDQEQMAEAWGAINAIIRDELESRRRSPRNDMLNGIAHGEIDGKQIDIESAVNLASTVFVGGLDTLPSNIGWTLRFLAEHPEHRQRIVDDPSCIPTAVEEFFRRFPSVAKNETRATRDIDFHGANIRAGDRVVTVLFLANCDSDVFEDPLQLDFDRTVNKHISFSVGSHRCLGSHLARHELAVGLEEWHRAIPDYRIPADDAPRFAGGGVWAVSYLPLEWDV